MVSVKLPYGRGHQLLEIPEERCAGVMVSQMHDYDPGKSPEELVRDALENPVGTPRLCDLSRGKRKIVFLASDHTRPVPSKVIVPLMLEEIRKGNPEAEVTFLIATGCHRETSVEELTEKFGEKIVREEKIVVHDCDAAEMLVNLGKLPSGGDLIVNRLAVEADLLVAEGFIEPHFFAGFSGGRKSVLPGIASRKTVLYNHNAQFIDDPHARTGVLQDNPIHRDMVFAARKTGLDFICNVVINSEKEVVYAVAGDVEQAHGEGTTFLLSRCQAEKVPADIVVTTNGGYPLDQNIYQTVKGMTAAEATVKKDGVIIMLAGAGDGHGGNAFFETFRKQKNLEQMMRDFLATPAEETIVDQWQSQILARVLLHAGVIFVSDAPDEVVREFQMVPARTVQEALALADQILAQKGICEGKILAIPDGVSVIVR